MRPAGLPMYASPPDPRPSSLPLPVTSAGETLSEGGFLPNKVAAASVLDVQEATDKKGKKYYKVRCDLHTRYGRVWLSLQQRRRCWSAGACWPSVHGRRGVL